MTTDSRATFHTFLRGLRLAYLRLFYSETKSCVSYDYPSIDKANEAVFNLINGESPCMIARFGNTELLTICNYISVHSHSHSFLKYLKGEEPPWWWDAKSRFMMGNNAGFFPLDDWSIEKFCSLMLEDTLQLDLLGSWLKEELYLSHLLKDIPKTNLFYLEPFFSSTPWTRVLAGKKVLVIHPFAELIESQYRLKHRKFFTNPDILPEFELETIKAVQSMGGKHPSFPTWFDALEWMENEITHKDFDIALIGCGAYGFPLAAFVKRLGKKAIHLGGVLQLLFGIKGARWENSDYLGGKYRFLFNEYWIRPGDTLRPANASSVENACYW